MAGRVVGDVRAACVVCKDGWEEALCGVEAVESVGLEDLCCGSGESGRTEEDGVGGT